jgi:hypothetical protein
MIRLIITVCNPVFFKILTKKVSFDGQHQLYFTLNLTYCFIPVIKAVRELILQ